jgi:hypothetical protein
MGIVILCFMAGCEIKDDISGDEPDADTKGATSEIESGAMFLLAGQSNMVGNVDRGLFDQLISELGSGTATTRQQRLIDRLKYWYQNNDGGYASYGYSDAMASLEASELIRLNGAGLVNSSLTQPYSKVYCTSLESPTPNPLALNCGNPFGPELVLGHVLGATSNPPTSLIKVAVGGSTLYTDWLPPSAASRTGRSVGALYKQLSQRIKSLSSNPASVHPNCASQKCRWAGFIWFQGENDSMGQAEAAEYQKNLASLISDVRSETGSAQLPVIIVGIGRWAQKDLDYGATVLAAEKAVVNADSRARFVATDDLSGYYHYDPAAQLIIGERVGKALVPLVGGTTTDLCPNDPNKTEPGLCGCGVPEGTCGGGTSKCAQADEFTTASLSCPSGQVIKSISFASYGTPSGSCPNFAKGTCHASTSQSNVQSLCLNKPSCSVESDNSVFGDPCSGIGKKLAIVYTCSGGSVDNCPNDPNKTEPGLCGCGVPEGTCSGGTKKCAQADEFTKASLSCPSGQTINAISFASWGTPSGTCPNFVKGTCHAATSQSKVQSLCLNKQSCIVKARNAVFGDPCSGVGKKLAVVYTCSGGVVDNCPNDPNKTEPGQCGCGVPEGTCSGGTSYQGSGRLLNLKDHLYILDECDPDEDALLKSEGFKKVRRVSVGNWTNIFTIQASSLVEDKILADIAGDAEYLLRPIVERYPDRLKKVLDRKGGTFNVIVVYGSGWGISGGMGDGPQVYKRWGAYGGGLHHEMGHIFDIWSASDVFRSHVDSILSAEDAAVLDRYCGNTVDPQQDFRNGDGSCQWSEFIAEQYHWMSFPDTIGKVKKNLPEVYRIILKYIPTPSDRVPLLK